MRERKWEWDVNHHLIHKLHYTIYSSLKVCVDDYKVEVEVKQKTGKQIEYICEEKAIWEHHKQIIIILLLNLSRSKILSFASRNANETQTLNFSFNTPRRSKTYGIISKKSMEKIWWKKWMGKITPDTSNWVLSACCCRKFQNETY